MTYVYNHGILLDKQNSLGSSFSSTDEAEKQGNAILLLCTYFPAGQPFFLPQMAPSGLGIVGFLDPLDPHQPNSSLPSKQDQMYTRSRCTATHRPGKYQ
ncbi:hypothetical protein PCASD_12564 [Puccinia coronata f. sp. avenae]|uniref:Uncharacterized protein n=1 Tax=Puccinia coronata f. sp. avenae TaxID=200324 RepID=A0A2N5UM07_9BASI|nr:hypothetical protein PCASD_12564 [Puccinia coronata f. sp. avenae]